VKILVINGPNLNLLGIREPEIYGKRTYNDLKAMIQEHANRKGVMVEIFQSNHEGAIVDKIQEGMTKFDGLVINPGAYTHTSIAILDAVKGTGMKTVEIHISDPDTREDFRKISYIRPACIATVKGEGLEGYLKAMDILIDSVENG